MCGAPSSEPLTPELEELRLATCSLGVEAVRAIQPLLTTNPPNVQLVESIVPEGTFLSMFPSTNPAYTYPAFLQAVGMFPAVCRAASTCRRVLAALFAHMVQESRGLEVVSAAEGEHCEASRAARYPCTPGKQYHGRGALQLTGSYNYGAFSEAMFGDKMVLLDNPDLVAASWLNFAASLWEFVTPRPPRPSALQVLDGSWTPGAADVQANLDNSFGTTILVLGGGLECGPSHIMAASARGALYSAFAKGYLGVDITGENLACSTSTHFPENSSAATKATFWDFVGPGLCKLTNVPSAFSALVEGEFRACLGAPQSCSRSNSVITTFEELCECSCTCTEDDTSCG